MTIFDFISLAGGLALFLYGMRVMGDGLKAGSSGVLKKALEKATGSPVTSFLLGMAVTALIQSSTATIVLTSGLVGAGLISLHNSIGIILGANVGTTVTGQIIRLLDINASGTSFLNFFKPSTLAPIAAIIGIIVIMTNKSRRSSTVGSIAVGFGILFTGLINMTSAVSPLSESEAFARLFTELGKNPVIGYLVGTGVAFVLQSSSATIGILQALSTTGALTFNSVYAIIIGIYTGDAVTTAIVCSIGSKADAKRTGVVHCLFNLSEEVFIIIMLLVLKSLGVLDGIWNMTMTSGSIANTHTVFNLVSAVCLLPLSGKYEMIARRVIKDDPQIGESVDRELGMLDQKLFTSPALALSASKEAIAKMISLARANVNSAMDVLVDYDAHTIEVVRENEIHIDHLADAVDNYLVAMARQVPGAEDDVHLNFHTNCFGEFERVGDYAVNLTECADDLQEQKVKFSPLAVNELEVLRSAINEILDITYQAFTTLDEEAAKRIEPIEEVVDDLVAILRSNHIKRVREGLCSIPAGLEFLDVLVNVERVADQCSNVGIYTLALTNARVMENHHDYIREIHAGQDPLFNKYYNEARKKYLTQLDQAEETEK